MVVKLGHFMHMKCPTVLIIIIIIIVVVGIVVGTGAGRSAIARHGVYR